MDLSNQKNRHSCILLKRCSRLNEEILRVLQKRDAETFKRSDRSIDDDLQSDKKCFEILMNNEWTNKRRERERERERSNDIDPNVARQNFSRNVNWTFERRRSTFIFRCKFEANASNYYYYDNDYYDDDDNDNDDGAITIRPSDASTNRKFPETGCPVVGSPGLAVMKWDSRSKCFVFESQRILDGHFSHVLFS